LVKEDTHDSLLWQQFKAGSDVAFYKIYDGYVNLLYNYGIKFTKDYGLVEDCIHDLFVSLWEKRANISDVKHPKYYLYTSLRRKIIRYEQRKYKYVVEDHEELQFSLRITPSIEDKIVLEQAAVERTNNLNKTLSRLSGRQREIIFLKFYENFSPEEIAALMCINIESVYKLTNKALTTIRNLIKEGAIFISVSLLLLLLSYL
jgi:RNA polymerase sigma factor (sigma-70 family)